MKVNTTKLNRAARRHKQGFTLIEMIGVLAVIAILAAVLIPKVFEAINNSRINNSAMTCNTAKTALVDHYAKFGSLPVDGTANPPTVITNLPSEQFDMTLLKEGFLDKPYSVKIGDGTSDTTHARVRLFDISATGTNAVTGAADSGFNLSGTGTQNEATGSVCAEAVITGVTASDAKDLNDRIDGTSLGSAINQADLKGRVKYAAPIGGSTTVYVYLTHR